MENEVIRTRVTLNTGARAPVCMEDVSLVPDKLLVLKLAEDVR